MTNGFAAESTGRIPHASVIHPGATVATAQEPPAVVVQPMPVSVAAAQGSRGVLSGTQSPLRVN